MDELPAPPRVPYWMHHPVMGYVHRGADGRVLDLSRLRVCSLSRLLEPAIEAHGFPAADVVHAEVPHDEVARPGD